MMEKIIVKYECLKTVKKRHFNAHILKKKCEKIWNLHRISAKKLDEIGRNFGRTI